MGAILTDLSRVPPSSTIPCVHPTTLPERGEEDRDAAKNSWPVKPKKSQSVFAGNILILPLSGWRGHAYPAGPDSRWSVRSMAHNIHHDGAGPILKMMEALLAESKRKSFGPTSNLAGGPSSTLGMVLQGTAVDFMIPGGPSHSDDVLEAGDEILEVDGVVVDSSNIDHALKGSDEIGSMVRLLVRKAEDGKREDVVLKRASLTYIHQMQVFIELMDQLKNACKKNPDVADLVRRVSSKVKELDAYHLNVEHDLRATLRRLDTSLSQLADRVRTFAINEKFTGVAAAQSSSLPGADDVAGIGTPTSREVDRIQALLRKSEAEKHSLQFRLDQMEKELNSRKLQSKDAENDTARPANSRLLEIRTARKEHYILMEQEIEDLSSQVQDYENALAAARLELKESKSRESKAQEQVSDFTRQLESKQHECAQAQADVFRLSRLKDQAVDTEFVRGQLRECEKQLHQAMQRETELDGKLSKSTEATQQLQTSFAMRESEMRSEISSLKEQFRSCQSKISEMNKEGEHLRMSERSLKQELAQAKTELQVKDNRSSDIEAELTRRNQDCRNELAQCQARLQQRTNELNDALQCERRLKTMSNEAHAVADSLHAARTQAEREFAERLSTLEEELERAQAKLVHYKAREQELSGRETQLNRRISQMEDDLRSLQSALRDSQAALHLSNAKVTELSDQVAQQDLGRVRIEEEAAVTKDGLSRQNQKLTSRLAAADDAVKQYEKQLTETQLALRKNQDHAGDLETKVQELQQALSSYNLDLNTLTDEFSQHSKARDWQLEAFKKRLQVADDKAKKACEREDQLLTKLESAQGEIARLECASVQKEMESRRQIDALHLKLESMQDILNHTAKDNETLHRLLEMPAEEFAFQAIERSGPMARSFRKSELPASRAASASDVWPRKLPEQHSEPPVLVSPSTASRRSSAGTSVASAHSELTQRDADLQQELSELRARMKDMELSMEAENRSPNLVERQKHAAKLVEPGPRNVGRVRGVNTVAPTANSIISSLNSSAYVPSQNIPSASSHTTRKSPDYLI